MNVFRKWLTCALVVAVAAVSSLALAKGPAGEPNESGSTIAEKLKNPETSIETIYGYFSHYSPVIRKRAAEAMAKRGEDAMPFIIKALKTGKKYEARAGCDAISGLRGFFGVNVKGSYPITPEMAATALPAIAALLDNKDVYVRVGALQALSKCGKAAAPYLPRVVKMFNDDEWWIRDGVGCVVEGVGGPETDKYLENMANAVKREHRIESLNNMCIRLANLLKKAPPEIRDSVSLLVAGNLPEMDDAFRRFRAYGILSALGTDAKVVLPIIDKLIEKQVEIVKTNEPKESGFDAAKWELNQLKVARDKIAGEQPKKK